jgi:polysaccharide pyruvyl transferase WcaK-like protein
MNRILITKLDTTNLGNEILSAEMVALVRREGFAVLGRPLDLHRYRISRLPTDPLGAVATFSAWADTLSTAFGVVRLVPVQAPRPSEPLVRTRGEAQVAASKQGPRALWSRLAEYLPFGPRYLARLSVLRTAEAVIYSGAGEVGEYDPFLRQALELEVLLRFGVRVHAVNHSVVTETPRMDAILRHIYRRFTSVVVRGEQSREKLLALGVAEHRVTVAPDTAWRVTRVEVEKTPGLHVGITVNGFSAELDAWTTIALGLKRLGARVIFLTSDPGYDLAAGRFLAERAGVEMAPQASQAEAYRRALGKLDLVISERLHTAVMAVVQGVHVIPIERGVHKTSEVFSVFGDGVEVVRPDPGWPNEVLKQATAILAAPGARRARLIERATEMAEAARLNVPQVC